jgi:hypothetical protein
MLLDNFPPMTGAASLNRVCEVDMVAHGGTSVAGSFIQTLTMVDVATGWTECRRIGFGSLDSVKMRDGVAAPLVSSITWDLTASYARPLVKASARLQNPALSLVT